jgi:Zn-dependent protease with chaperone function
MMVALTLLAGAFAAGWLVPVVLRWLDLRRCDPVLLIVAWLVSMAGVLLAAAGGVLLLLLPDHGPLPAFLASLHHCLSTVQHGSPPRVEETAGLLGAALLAAITIRVLVVSVRGIRRRASRRLENLAVLRLAARADAGPSDILWLPHERPLAFSIAGRPGVVVATDGLNRHLHHDAVTAVFAHERAHLAGRHHHLIAIADALHTALPFVPLFRLVPKVIRELVELAADAVAVRKCGPAAVHTALLGVAQHTPPGTALAIAQDAVDLRISRLRHGGRRPGRVTRTVACGLTGVTAVILPFVAGTGLLLGIALVMCPLTS